MAHELETMFYHGQVPWHNLGTKLENPATAKEAIIAARLNWSVDTVPIFAYDRLAAEGAADPVHCKSSNAVMRMSDRRILGLVGTRYMPVQNEDAFEFFDSVVGAGQAIYHTAGSLRCGQRVWILAQLPGDMMVTENDIVNRYLLLSNSHDGTTMLRMFYTPVRVVCMNTLNWALSRGSRGSREDRDGIEIRHTGSIKDKIEQAKNALHLGITYYEELAQISKAMLNVRSTDDVVNELLAACFPKAYAPDASERTKNVLADVRWIAGNGTKTVTPGTENTLWNYLNAVVQYADHGRSSRSTEYSADDNKLDSVWFGSAKRLKQVAFDTANVLMKKVGVIV